MERFRIEVGHSHKVMPGNIVGAIANEAGIDSKHIGRINIFDDYSTIDLPTDMPKEIFDDLKKVWVSGQTLKISRMSGKDNAGRSDNSADTRKPRRNSKASMEGTAKQKRKPKAKDKAKGKAKRKKVGIAK